MTKDTHNTMAASFTKDECKAVAKEFDGKTETIDRLWHRWLAIKPGLKRYQVARAAARGGFKTQAVRRPWKDPAEEEFLLKNWRVMSGDEMAAALGRTFNSVHVHYKRLKAAAAQGQSNETPEAADEFTIRELEELTGVGHRQWQGFIERGWLSARRRARRNDAPPITYVNLRALHSFLREHPDAFDYKAASDRATTALDLDRLPIPPKWKRVRCDSEAWSDRDKLTACGSRAPHRRVELKLVKHKFNLQSCGASGGTEFWAQIYAAPQCPRCGCQTGHYSVDGLFMNEDPDNDELLDIQARKLGLRWVDGGLLDASGRPVADKDIVQTVLARGRCGKGISAFAKLVETGLSVATSGAVAPERLLGNILALELRKDQEEAFQQFLASGAMTAAQAMSFGKSTLGLMAMTRIAGRHLLMVDTVLNRDQWIEKFSALAPKVNVKRFARPSRTEVEVFDFNGRLRSSIDIFSYLTKAKLDEGNWVVGCFDEVHRLPARFSYHHVFAKTEFRLGMSSTADERADGRGRLISKMTGPLVGDDWRPQMDSGSVKRIPVKVLIVEDVLHKHELVGQLFREHRSVVVMCESLEDGRELELRYGVPFVHSGTKNKLAVVRASRNVILSRIGDAGLSIPDCEVTVDHSGLFGSRIQSLQRLGRLMHSNNAKYHCILMTKVERYERFGRRVEAIRKKGFEVSEEVAPRTRAKVCSLMTPVLAQRVAPGENPFLAALGWRKDELNRAA